jgi:hypothetical protein
VASKMTNSSRKKKLKMAGTPTNFLGKGSSAAQAGSGAAMAAAGGSKKRPADEPAKDWEKTLEPVRKLATVLKAVRRAPPRFLGAARCAAHARDRGRAARGAGRGARRAGSGDAAAMHLRADAAAWFRVPLLSRGAQDPAEKKKPSDLGYDNLFEVRPRTRSVPRACCAMVPGVYPAR